MTPYVSGTDYRDLDGDGDTDLVISRDCTVGSSVPLTSTWTSMLIAAILLGLGSRLAAGRSRAAPVRTEPSARGPSTR